MSPLPPSSPRSVGRMHETVAEAIVRRLDEWGVERIFGYPGETINPILDALHQTGRPTFIQARHEEAAALMASGQARLNGQPGVVLTTTGPGAVHQLNGLYDARLDHLPVLSLMGYPARMAMGASYQQEIDLRNLFKDVAGAYAEMVTVPEQIPQVIDRALRTALGEHTVTALIVPVDVQTLRVPDEPPREHFVWYTAPGYSEPRATPNPNVLDQAAEILNAGERVAMLIGAGARGAVAEVVEVAEVLGAGVAKALLGKDVLPDDLPYVTGAIGLLGTPATARMMNECDTLLMVGSSFPYAEWLPEPGQARGVQVDRSPRMIGIRYPMESHLVGDARDTLRALLPRLERKPNRAWRERLEISVLESERELEQRIYEPADPMNPQLVVRRLAGGLPDDAVVVSDAGTATYWYARHVHLREGMRGLCTGLHATMGNSIPYALAAKLADSSRPVFVITGDGAMQMLGNNELITIAARWTDWADPRLVMLVLHNDDLAEVTWLMRNHDGIPTFPDSQHLPAFPYADYARLLGLDGELLDDPANITAVVERALDAERPFVLEALVDSTTPLLPPEIRSLTQEAIDRLFERGDPDVPDPQRLRQKLEAEGFPPA